MTSEQRIATVENDLDLVKELLLTTARHAERAHEDNDALRQELRASSARTEAAIAATNQKVDALTETVAATNQRVDAFVDGIQRLVTQQQERINQHEARVERLEDIAQTVLNGQVQATRRLDLLEQQVAQQQQQIELQQQQIEQQQQLFNLQRQQLELDRQRDEEFRRSTGAALERIDRILDYLVRQAGGEG